jgi:MoxR-like ATPase
MRTLHQAYRELQAILPAYIVNQSELTDVCFVSLLAGGHILLVGPPGVAKTRSANVLAHALGLPYKRIQFTADLLPSDIVGAEIFDPKNREFIIKLGPIYSSFILADEINRAPPKVQSALLEAMQERQITLA